MFSWLEEVQRRKVTSTKEHKPFSIQKMQLETSLTVMNELGQFFTAASFFQSDRVMVQLPANNPTALDFIVADIAPHFKNVKAVFIDNQVDVILMQYLKESSQQMFQDLVLKNGLNPVVSDLYRSHEVNLVGSHKLLRSVQRYKVRNESFEPLHLEGMSPIQRFIESAYFDRGDFLTLSPTGWKLEDELNQSVALHTFCSFVPHIELVVDADDLSVVGIELHP